MNRTRARFVRFFLWLILVLLALRPLEPVGAVTGILAGPVSLLTDLASPMKLLRRSRVLAAEERLAEGADRELEENARLLHDLSRIALPSERGLSAGRRLVHGEVLGASDKTRDQVRVRLADLRGVREGMPVASGNAYVGRIVEVPPGADASTRATVPGVVLVELVTARGFHVGARVEREGDEAVLMTVGGLDDTRSRKSRRSRSGVLRLAVHHPSDRSLSEGLARVHELFADAERYSDLAEGLHLGQVRREGEDGRVFLEPDLDYQDGLFHVVVLAPADPDMPAEILRDPSLLDSNWLQVSPLSVSDPSPWRETGKLRAGATDGVFEGAAVTSIGARLVGRIARVGRWTSEVSFLGDPGFSVVAVARFEDTEEPRVLGRLVSTGRMPDGSVRMIWKARVELGLEPTAEDGTRRARLFTGSGDSGLESGFFLGEARVPVLGLEDNPVLLLETDLDPRDTGSVFVRLDPDEGGLG